MKRNKGLAAVVVAILALVIIALLNPTSEDFQSYLSAKAGKASGKSLEGLGGLLQKGAGALASGVAAMSASLYARKDYLFFSTYSAGKSGDLYLGIAKKLFIKLR